MAADLLIWIESELDLSYVHAALTFLGAIAAIWVMQHTTQQAGFGSTHARGLLCLRAALAMLSIALALNGAFVIAMDVSPWMMDTIVIALLLVALMTTPFALPRHVRKPGGCLICGGSDCAWYSPATCSRASHSR